MFEIGLAIHCFWNMDFREIARWSSEHKITSLEISCLPSISQKNPLSGNFNNLSAINYIDEIKEICNHYQINIQTLSCNINMLHEVFHKKNMKYLMNTLRLAKELDTHYVCILLGKNSNIDITKNIELLHDQFLEAYEFAKENKIRILFENCPGEGKEQVNNIGAISSLWDSIFSVLNEDVFGLTLDLSHCIMLEDDYLELISKHRNRIYNIHAKDCIAKNDVIGKSEYCLPGEGVVKWDFVIQALKDIQHHEKLILMIENESHIWTQNEEKACEGIIKARDYLREVLDEN